MNIDRCCNCSDAPYDWPCDEGTPPCIMVVVDVFDKLACEFPAGYSCMNVPDAAPASTFFGSIDRTHSVEGINGVHILSGLSGSAYCSVRGEFEDNDSVLWIGIVYEQININVTLSCMDENSDPLNEWHVVGCTITTQNGGGAGCNDGVIFSWSSSTPVPFGTALANQLSNSCSTNTKLVDINNAVVSIYGIDCPSGLPFTTYYAESCDDPDVRITVDIAARPANHQYCLYGGDKYRLTGIRSSETAVTVTWDDQSCPLPTWPIWYRCDGVAGSITVDPSTLAPGTQTVRYGGVIYYNTGKLSTQTPVTVESLTEPCPTPQYRIGRRCDGLPGEVSYDPASQSPGTRTFFYDGDKYYPTNITTSSPAQVVIWSASGCNTGGPGPINPCVDPACQQGSPNFPDCCDAPWWADCPACNSVSLTYRSKILRSVAGTTKGKPVKTTGPRKRGLVSEAELDAMGHSPEAEAQSLKQGGCCDPPRE